MNRPIPRMLWLVRFYLSAIWAAASAFFFSRNDKSGVLIELLALLLKLKTPNESIIKLLFFFFYIFLFRAH